MWTYTHILSYICAYIHVHRPVGPILVLVGLKYRGNIGSIVRSAVQADFFEAIYLIQEDYHPSHSFTTTAASRNADRNAADASPSLFDGIGGDETCSIAEAHTHTHSRAHTHETSTHEWCRLVGEGWARAAGVCVCVRAHHFYITG
jgi:tRNA C32,U32 (ribose-2'-O)-methylase TrmJ